MKKIMDEFEEMPSLVRYLAYLGTSVAIVAFISFALANPTASLENLHISVEHVLIVAVVTTVLALMDMTSKGVGKYSLEKNRYGEATEKPINFFSGQLMRLILGAFIFGFTALFLLVIRDVLYYRTSEGILIAIAGTGIISLGIFYQMREYYFAKKLEKEYISHENE